MTGWRLAVALLLAFSGGVAVISWFHAATTERFRAMVAGLKRLQQHEQCAQWILHQQQEIDSLRAYADQIEADRIEGAS